MTAQENPFKFGTVVDGDFFTDRTQELPKVRKCSPATITW